MMESEVAIPAVYRYNMACLSTGEKFILDCLNKVKDINYTSSQHRVGCKLWLILV